MKYELSLDLQDEALKAGIERVNRYQHFHKCAAKRVVMRAGIELFDAFERCGLMYCRDMDKLAAEVGAEYVANLFRNESGERAPYRIMNDRDSQEPNILPFPRAHKNSQEGA